MNSYYNNLSTQKKEYFKVLSADFPKWLEDYINTEEMQRIGNISMDCGCCYTNLFEKHPWYSNLDHSVGVALILWHFTHDKKQTLAGLFHDIATPVFKHCIDFMNGDSLKQESTEERTTDIIRNSKRIMALLKRDNIQIEEVNDYKIYPIADNDTPCLAADRFEYNFSSGYIIHNILTLDDIKLFYNNVDILRNETGNIELGFKSLKTAEDYVHLLSKLWPYWINDADRTSMQFYADICLSMSNLGYLSIDDLYTLSESEVIDRIINCQNEYISSCFKKFLKTNKCHRSDTLVSDKYCINVKGKRRYINPLVSENDVYGRIYDLSSLAKKDIDNYMSIPIEGYTYLDFDFKPIVKEKIKER